MNHQTTSVNIMSKPSRKIAPEILHNGDLKLTDHITHSSVILNNDLRDFLSKKKK